MTEFWWGYGWPTAIVVIEVLIVAVPLLLAIAYLAVFRASPPAESRMAKGALVAVGVLALWGLGELGVQGTARARAVFETPATYAAVLNLALVPLAGAVLSGSRARLAVPAVLLLAAAVFAAQSRGAMLALAGGIGVALVLGARARRLRTHGMEFRHPRALPVAVDPRGAGVDKRRAAKAPVG